MTPAKRPNRELVVYVLGEIGGLVTPVHTEDIALRAHKLFPDIFAWSKYPELPDKDIVRVALTDARKPRYGGLVEGRSGQSAGQSSKTLRKPAPDGWLLTSAGIDWFKMHAPALEALSGTLPRNDYRHAPLQRLRRILNHPVFHEYQKSPNTFDPSLGEIASLARCRLDAPDEVWRDRFSGIERDADMSNRPDIIAFIAVCLRAYDVLR